MYTLNYCNIKYKFCVYLINRYYFENIYINTLGDAQRPDMSGLQPEE